MTAVGWAMLVAVCGIVWGGFAVLLARALRREHRKQGGGESGRRP